MREWLDDADGHRQDGYGRAQAHVKRALSKRFYNEVLVRPDDTGFAITLDGRVPKTPGQRPLVVPTPGLAAALAAEWAAQVEFVDPATMPLTRLVNSGIEAGVAAAPALRAEIVKFAANDLLLYRAEAPASLVERQEALWDDILIKLARRFEVAFQPTLGIRHQPQPSATLDRLAGALADDELFPLVALNALTAIMGSGLLAIAWRAGLIDAEAAWRAAHVDEDHNIAHWGEVAEITKRRAQRRADFDAALQLMSLA